MTDWIRHALPLPLRPPTSAETRRAWPTRLAISLGWLVAIVIQCGLVWLVAELVDVAHGLMELWLQLANQHLDLVSLYNSVRPE